MTHFDKVSGKTNLKSQGTVPWLLGPGRDKEGHCDYLLVELVVSAFVTAAGIESLEKT